jgi:hypothetical protein
VWTIIKDATSLDQAFVVGPNWRELQLRMEHRTVEVFSAAKTTRRRRTKATAT